MPDATRVDVRPSGYAEILLRVLAIGGYGLWIWLGVALLLGLLEGMRWQSLGVPRGVGGETPVHDMPPARFVAAVFIDVLPCATLLLTERFGGAQLRAGQDAGAARLRDGAGRRVGGGRVKIVRMAMQRRSLQVQAIPLR